jgi:ribosomal protein L11 methyltransferase
MHWLAAKVIFESEKRALAFELIGSVFFDIGLKGIVQDDPDLEPTEGWGPDALKPAHKPAVTGYFADNEHLSNRCHKLEQALTRIQQTIDLHYQIVYQRLDEEDWAHSWKAFFHPERLSSRIVVKPTWEDYVAEQNDLVLEIDPGMAFGTGTHPTTSLCIQLIEKYQHPGQTLLDIGTGSGILMIAAAKLGAAQVTGVDIDEVAVQVARENLDFNGIRAPHGTVTVGDLTTVADRQFDLVVANILSDVITALLDDIHRVLLPKGLFICSGIIVPKKDQILQKMTSVGMATIETVSLEDWVAIVGQHLNQLK